MKNKIHNINLMIGILFLNHHFDWRAFQTEMKVIPFSQRESLSVMTEKFDISNYWRYKFPKYSTLFAKAEQYDN